MISSCCTTINPTASLLGLGAHDERREARRPHGESRTSFGFSLLVQKIIPAKPAPVGSLKNENQAKTKKMTQ